MEFGFLLVVDGCLLLFIFYLFEVISNLIKRQSETFALLRFLRHNDWIRILTQNTQ
ncbi:hypothetical protein SAMN05421785_12420 [Chryseobacterium gambrini]|uniref:Uncharacterized protein n=1 Tax=Chryseobacterium gambrini TaxID=373672 RepID=A0A1N7QYW3_9FLAO|nr:hypothetical protein SAMN05421785_12420 [Chryseobacterium gambrini]